MPLSQGGTRQSQLTRQWYFVRGWAQLLYFVICAIDLNVTASRAHTTIVSVELLPLLL